ncbi:MAG: HAD family hydrolase [Candidatus Thorarchaeota archaeon]|nr:HAD family hydrolase [Candidatus Thorarchaeota archaeon]
MTDQIQCKAVIFDFDGTLANSMPFLERIGVNVMMKYYGLDREEATNRYRITTGLPYEHQIKINFPDHPKNEEAIEEFERLKIEKIFDQELFPDTVRTLFALKEKGIKIFVSSSTFQSTIVSYFERRNLRTLFTDILGYKPGFEKGSDHFNYVRDRHRIPLEDVIFVGDSLKDYERAKGYCRFIAMVGLFSEQDFRDAGHKGLIVRELSAIPPALAPVEVTA